MMISALGRHTGSSAALTLLDAAPAVQGGGEQKTSSAPPFSYGGSRSTGISVAAYTIETILRSRFQTSAPSSAAGIERLISAAGKFQQAGITLQFRIDGAPAGPGIAEWMGDRNIGHVAAYAETLPLTPEDALRQYGEIARQATSRPGASDFSRKIHQAYLDGAIDLVPAEDYGVRFETVVTFHFFSNGEGMGGSIKVSTPPDALTFEDLKQTRLKEQADGSWKDVETGRYAAGIFFGGRGFIATFD